MVPVAQIDDNALTEAVSVTVILPFSLSIDSVYYESSYVSCLLCHLNMYRLVSSRTLLFRDKK